MLDATLALQVTLWLFLIWYFIRRSDAAIYHPLALYLIFHGIVFVLRPLLVYTLNFESQWSYLQYYPTETESILTLIVSSVGLIAFYGTVLSQKQIASPELIRRKVSIRRPEINALFLSWLLLGPVALYSLIFTIEGTQFNVEGKVQMEVVGGISIFVNTTGYIVDAKNMLITLVVLTAYVGRYKWWSLVPLAIFVGYRAFLGWGRWAMVIAMLSVFFLYLWEHNRKWPGKWMLIISIFILGLFTTIGGNRDIIRSWITDGVLQTSVAEHDAWYEKLDGPDFANFDYLAYVIRTVPGLTQTYTYGTQYLQLFTEPIPRVLWENKPVGSPVKLLDLNDYGNFEYRTTTLVGDGWLSGGWTGMILTMAFAGLALGRLFAWFSKSQWSDNRSVLYLISAPALIILYRDGGISIMKIWLFVLVPFALWLLIIAMIEKTANSRRQQALK